MSHPLEDMFEVLSSAIFRETSTTLMRWSVTFVDSGHGASTSRLHFTFTRHQANGIALPRRPVRQLILSKRQYFLACDSRPRPNISTAGTTNTTTATMQTTADLVLLLVLLSAFCLLVLASQTKAASPLSALALSASASAFSLSYVALALSLYLPVTEVLPAPSSVAPPVGSCRLYPLIEGKLPLSPKAVEPSYEVWVPQQGPPQRPGNGLIPKAQRRPRRGPEPHAVAPRRPVNNPLSTAPSEPTFGQKVRWHGPYLARRKWAALQLENMKRDADRKNPPPHHVDLSKWGQKAFDARAAQRQQQQQQPLSTFGRMPASTSAPVQQQSQRTASNPLLHMKDDRNARNEICNWLEAFPMNQDDSLAMDQLWAEIQQRPDRILDIGRQFAWWMDWGRNGRQGPAWDSGKYDVGRMKGTIPLVSSTCRFLDTVSQNYPADHVVSEILDVVTRVRDDFQWAIRNS